MHPTRQETKILVLGGHDGTAETDLTCVYDVDAGSWTCASGKMPMAAWNPGGLPPLIIGGD